MSTRIGRKKLDLEHSNRLRTAVQGEYIFFFEHVIIRIFFCHKVSFFFPISSCGQRWLCTVEQAKKRTSAVFLHKEKDLKSFVQIFFWIDCLKGATSRSLHLRKFAEPFFFSSSKAIRVNPLSLVSLVPFCLLITFYVFYPNKRLFQDSVLKKNLTYARMISDMVNYLLWYVLIHSQGGCVEYWVHQRRKGPKRLSQVPAPLSGNPRLKKKVKKPRNLLRKRE